MYLYSETNGSVTQSVDLVKESNIQNNEQEYVGKITKIHFQKDDFKIATFLVENEGEIKIKGSLYGIEKDEKIAVTGTWEHHAKYGNQLVISYWERPMPSTKEQAVTFLVSPLVKSCGVKYATRIVDVLGDRAIEIINEQGEDVLLDIQGIGKKRANSIAESVRSNFEVQKVINKLRKFGISPNLAIKAYKEFKKDTVDILQENPYKLIKLDSVSFPKADEIARKMGIMPISAFRVDACLEYVLNRMCYQTGHCYVFESELFTEVLKELNANAKSEDVVTLEEVQDSVYRLEEQRIIIEENRVYPKFLYKYEDEFAKKISCVVNSKKEDLIPTNYIDNLITQYQRKNSIILAEKQREAIRLILKEKVLILTGGPGTGKTTVVKGIVDVFKKVYPKSKIALVAPTGRASRKLSEVTEMDASTIHKLIGYRQGEQPKHHNGFKLEHKLLIVDEMSMVDIQLASLLLDAVENDVTVLFVGDIDQLPSVNPGNVLSDLIHSGLPTIRLTEVFRQAKESQIVTNAHRINQGKPVLIDDSKNDFFFIQNESLGNIAELTVLSVLRFLELGYSMSDILVLSPVKKGIIGTEELNEKIRERINPPAANKAEITVGKKVFREGDKIIQLKNDDEKNIFNGDLGVVEKIIQNIEPNKKQEDVMVCDYAGRKVTYTKEELHDIDLAYAITIHKSQGGESPIVIIPVSFNHGRRMLARNLMYTGLTRAKKIMVFIGQMEALNYAISNNRIAIRNSCLSERIQHYIEINSRFKTKKI